MYSVYVSSCLKRARTPFSYAKRKYSPATPLLYSASSFKSVVKVSNLPTKKVADDVAMADNNVSQGAVG